MEHEQRPPRAVSVVIPVYNSMATLRALLERLLPVLAAFAGGFEVILVNDGSRDASWQTIVGLAREYPFVRGINLMRNFGQHNALLAGIRAARYPVIVTMDDDLQHPPEEMPRLLDKLDQGFDVVYGTPRRRPHSLWRNFTSWLTKRLMASVVHVKGAEQMSAFRAFRTEVRNAFAAYQSPTVFLDVLLSWGTTRFAAVKVQHDPRRVGKSNYTLRKLLRMALMLLTGFSTAPLRFATFIGFVFTGLGAGVLVYVVVRAVIQGSVPGFPFLASIIAIFSGAQLFALGIIGEYLAVTHNRLMERPVYVVRDAVGADDHVPAVVGEPVARAVAAPVAAPMAAPMAARRVNGRSLRHHRRAVERADHAAGDTVTRYGMTCAPLCHI